MTNLEVQIACMKESSGNTQYFVRCFNKDNKEVLEYSCYQTKYYDIKDCLTRAWFDVGFVARFFNHPNRDVKLINFSNEDIEYIIKQRNLNRVR